MYPLPFLLLLHSKFHHGNVSFYPYLYQQWAKKASWRGSVNFKQNLRKHMSLWKKRIFLHLYTQNDGVCLEGWQLSGPSLVILLAWVTWALGFAVLRTLSFYIQVTFQKESTFVCTISLKPHNDLVKQAEQSLSPFNLRSSSNQFSDFPKVTQPANVRTKTQISSWRANSHDSETTEACVAQKEKNCSSLSYISGWKTKCRDFYTVLN